MKSTTYQVAEVLDWKLKNQTLRQAIVDEAEKDLEVGDLEGTIEVTLAGYEFVATFKEEKISEYNAYICDVTLHNDEGKMVTIVAANKEDVKRILYLDTRIKKIRKSSITCLKLDEFNKQIEGTGCVLVGFTHDGQVRVENEDGEFLYLTGEAHGDVLKNLNYAVQLVLDNFRADIEGSEAWDQADPATRGETYTKFRDAAFKRIRNNK